MAFSALGSEATLYLVSNVDVVQSSKVQAFSYRVPFCYQTSVRCQGSALDTAGSCSHLSLRSHLLASTALSRQG